MRLWTMQTPDIDLRDIHYKIDHRKSPFVDHFPKYHQLCKILSEQLKLGTDQYIWCLTEDEKTWDGREKWELDVPQEFVRLICSITWHWILTRSNEDCSECTPPERIFHLCWQLNINLRRKPNPGFNRDSFRRQFHSGWRDKNVEELWDMLSVTEIGPKCAQALVLLPVAKDWITAYKGVRAN